jgi:putative Mg2+ transporter-C (MgtC) family protein
VVHVSHGEILLRLALTAILCGAIGLERESRDQVAGLRTHILVGVGATLFTLVSAYAFQGFSQGGRVYDPTRIAAQIVSGIGFLGAGAIIRQGFNVRGLTTAAALWVSAAIGMAMGAGYYFGGVITTAVVLGSLVIFRLLRPALMPHLRTEVVLVDLEVESEAQLSDLLVFIAGRGARLQGMSSERENGDIGVRLDLRVPPEVDVQDLLSDLAGRPGLEKVQASGARFARRQVVPVGD